MSAEQTNKKEDKTKSESSGPKESGMFEMMKKCCAGQGGFPDCSGMMKSMMGAMTKQHCGTPNEDAAESKRRRK